MVYSIYNNFFQHSVVCFNLRNADSGRYFPHFIYWYHIPLFVFPDSFVRLRIIYKGRYDLPQSCPSACAFCAMPASGQSLQQFMQTTVFKCPEYAPFAWPHFADALSDALFHRIGKPDDKGFIEYEIQVHEICAKIYDKKMSARTRRLLYFDSSCSYCQFRAFIARHGTFFRYSRHTDDYRNCVQFRILICMRRIQYHVAIFPHQGLSFLPGRYHRRIVRNVPVHKDP